MDTAAFSVAPLAWGGRQIEAAVLSSPPPRSTGPPSSPRLDPGSPPAGESRGRAAPPHRSRGRRAHRARRAPRGARRWVESPTKEEADGELAMEIESSVTAEDWHRALSVVVLRTTAPRAFDTEVAGASYSTGFVVDKTRGIILTNRHVVKPGPVVAEAMFVNREEIPVYPLYRDPVHDFGFFRYDPGAIKFLKYDEIPLAPEAASVGLEIRVVGNDSGEKLLYLAFITPIVHDFYNYDMEKAEFAQIFGKFTQDLALIGALLFFLGLKNSIPKRQAKKKAPKAKMN